MRYPSMKSVVATLSIAVCLVAAVPTASAAAAHTPNNAQESRTREDRADKGDRIEKIRQFINRALRRFGTHNGPTIPIPGPTDQQ